MPEDTRFIQVAIPAPMARIMFNACRALLQLNHMEHDKGGPTMDGTTLNAVMEIKDFWEYAAEHPTAFPPTGVMAESIKTRKRRMKGPAQPAPRKKRTRHQRRLEAARKRGTQ